MGGEGTPLSGRGPGDAGIRPRYGPGFPSFPFPATRFREKAAINPLFFQVSRRRNTGRYGTVWAADRGRDRAMSWGMWGNPPFQVMVYDGTSFGIQGFSRNRGYREGPVPSTDDAGIRLSISPGSPTFPAPVTRFRKFRLLVSHAFSIRHREKEELSTH